MRVIALSLVLASVFFVGCEATYSEQNSSKEEALFMVQQTESYGETLFYMNVKTIDAINDDGSIVYIPVAFKPSFDDTVEVKFSHMMLTQKGEGSLWMVLLNDERPPQIVGEYFVDVKQEYEYK